MAVKRSIMGGIATLKRSIRCGSTTVKRSIRRGIRTDWTRKCIFTECLFIGCNMSSGIHVLHIATCRMFAVSGDSRSNVYANKGHMIRHEPAAMTLTLHT